MRLFFSFLLLCFVGVQSTSVAQESPSPQDTQFSEWMTYYYFHKNTAKMNDFLQWIQSRQFLERNEEEIPPVTAFLSLVFTDNPRLAQD